MAKNKIIDDAEDLEMLKSYKNSDFTEVEDMQAAISQMKNSASAYMSKKSRINIRLSDTDLLKIKRKAAEDGMPYQTLIAGILHKYVTGQVVIR
ncbi:MAG: antitoxin [Pseudomonadota bacterium]